MFDKRYFFVFLLACIQNIYSQQGDSIPVIKFDVDTADFGRVYEGDTVKYDFWFTNTGSRDLVIKQAWPACGCTHPSFTKGIIKPGGRGVIHVEFLSAGWAGKDVVKEVIIISNAPENYARFKASIVDKSLKPAPVKTKTKKKKKKKASPSKDR